MQKIFEGEIVGWNEIKRFGFISYEHHGRKRIYFCARTIQPDWKGSRAWAFGTGIPVTFEIDKRKDTKSETISDIAINVAPIFPMSEPENLRGYREVSVVRKKEFDVVFLTRPCGDTLFLHKNDVANDPARWDLLVTDSPVYHGIEFDQEKEQWRASDAELYSFEELYEFQHEDDPQVEAEVAPETNVAREAEPQPELVSSVLAPATRNKPLIQLIMEKRAKA
jgi:hypothetical protein